MASVVSQVCIRCGYMKFMPKWSEKSGISYRMPLGVGGERHTHMEEMFMIAGDMPCSRGIMREGAYFWRPPSIWHGADCTVNGFLMFMRTPGTNRTISEWADQGHPVHVDPPHRPILPAELADAGTERLDFDRY